MDGIHDMGGMHGFGPVVREKNEPVFHARWEPVVMAMTRAMRSDGGVTLDQFRHAIERMDPPHYLSATYYEHWLESVARTAAESGVTTPAEIQRRSDYFLAHPDAPVSALFDRVRPAHRAAATPIQGVIRTGTTPPRFKPGDKVITRSTRPEGHTRLPRYARGKRGTVHLFHGVHVFPDSNAHGLGEDPQPVYSVRFEGRDLWGESREAPQAVYLDLFERYLSPVVKKSS